MKQWELNEIMKCVEAVGRYKWEIELGSEVDDSVVDIVAVPLSGHARYSVAQEVAYDDANFIVHALQDIPRLVARIKELEQALKFYADAKNHDETARSLFNSEYYQSKVMIDGGKLAMEVLRNDD